MSHRPRTRRPLASLTEAASRALSVGRVFGEPIIAGETTVIPVATVIGSHGIGYGEGGMNAQGASDRAQGPHAPHHDSTHDDHPGHDAHRSHRASQAADSDAGSNDGSDTGAVASHGAHCHDHGSHDHGPGHPHGSHCRGHLHRPGGAGRFGSSGNGGGGGGGFGVLGWPAGAYVVTREETRWRPAVDSNLLVLGGAALVGCVVTSIASVAAIKVISQACAQMATAGADAFARTAETAANSLTQVATATSTAFASAAGSAAGAFGAAAGKATEAVVAGAGAAQATALGVTQLGSRAFSDAVGHTGHTLASVLRKR